MASQKADSIRHIFWGASTFEHGLGNDTTTLGGIKGINLALVGPQHGAWSHSIDADIRAEFECQ
jgi:hypothetical protein